MTKHTCTCGICGKSMEKTSDPRVKVIIAHYNDTFIKVFGTKPSIMAKDAAAVKRMLKTSEEKHIIDNIPGFFKTDDKYFKNNGYNLTMLERYLEGIKTGGYDGQKISSSRGARARRNDDAKTAARNILGIRGRSFGLADLDVPRGNVKGRQSVLDCSPSDVSKMEVS